MTIDELVVKLILDTKGFTEGQKEATKSAETTAALLKAIAGRGEKAQTDAAEKTAAAQVRAAEKASKALEAEAKKAEKAREKASKAAEAEAKKVQAEAKKVQEANAKTVKSVEGTIRTFLTLFGILTGTRSLTNFVEQMIGLDATVGRLGHNVGSTSETISSIGRAVERAGGSFDGAASGIQSFSDAFQDLRTTGQSSIMEPLAKLQAMGGKPITIGKDWHKSLLQIGDDLHALDKKDPALADYLGRQVLHDPNLVNWAKRGGPAMLADEDKSPKITKEQAELAKQLQERIAALKQSFQDTGNAILMDFGPAMLSGLRWIKDLIDANRGLIETKVKEWVQEVGAWFKAHKEDIIAFGRAVGTIASAFAGVVAAVSGQSPLAVAFEAFGALLALRILAPLRAIVTTIGLLGSTALPGWVAKLLGIVVPVAAPVAAAVVASTSPLNAGEPTVSPDGRLTYPDGHSERGRVWDGHATHGAQIRDRAYHNQVDDRNIWQRTAPKWAGGKDAPGSVVQVPTDAHTPLKDLIAKHETGTTGAGGYDTAYGHAEQPGSKMHALAPPKPLTEMTLAEVLAYQREMKPRAGSPAFPVGRGQWVEKTLRGLTAKMDQNTKFTPEVQEKLFDRSIRPRLGQGPAGMRAEWDSMRSVSDGEIQTAIDGHRKAMAFMQDRPRTEPATAAPQASAGAKGQYPEWMDERSRREMAGVNAPLARDLLAASEATGQKFKVAQGMRTPEEAAGNALSGRGVRNSQHLYGAAADIHLLDANGNVTYDRAAYQKFADAYEDHSRKNGGNSRWLGNAGGRWGQDIVHFDQGLGYGQSRARDPYGSGGPTKEDVAASRQDSYKSPQNPFMASRDRGPGGSPSDVARVETAKQAAVVPPSPVAEARRASPPVEVAPKSSPAPQPAGPAPVSAPKPAPVPSAAAGYGREHNAGRPQVPNMSGSAPMLPAGRMMTLDDAANHVLKTMKGANDNRPVTVNMTDASATKIGVAGKSGIDMLIARHSGALRAHVGAELKKSGAEMDRAFSKAWTGLGHHAGIGAGERAWQAVNHAHHQTTTHTVDNSSATKVGTINVHTAATDAKGIAADIEPHLARGQAAGRANYGLA